MFCRNCGSEIIDGTKYCANCGSFVDTDGNNGRVERIQVPIDNNYGANNSFVDNSIESVNNYILSKEEFDEISRRKTLGFKISAIGFCAKFGFIVLDALLVSTGISAAISNTSIGKKFNEVLDESIILALIVVFICALPYIAEFIGPIVMGKGLYDRPSPIGNLLGVIKKNMGGAGIGSLATMIFFPFNLFILAFAWVFIACPILVIIVFCGFFIALVDYLRFRKDRKIYYSENPDNQ